MDVLVFDNYPRPHCPVNQHTYSVGKPLDKVGIAEPFYIIIPDTLNPRYESGEVFVNLPNRAPEALTNTLAANSGTGMPELCFLNGSTVTLGTYGVPWI